MYRLKSLSKNQRELAAYRPAGARIPHNWMNHLRTARGHPWPICALVLSEIVFWATPVVSLDDQGQVTYYKRHKGSMYQADYQQIGDHWGVSKRTVRKAVDYLVSKGLVDRHLKTVVLKDGVKLTNVPFLVPNMAAIKSITFDKPGLMGPSSDHLKPVPMGPDIYTKHYTQNTLKDSAPVGAGPEDKQADKPETDHTKAMRLYQEALGYPIPNGAQTGAGIRKILKAGYSPEQMIACYHWMKRDKFWQGKMISVQSIHKALGEFVKSAKSSVPLTASQADDINQEAWRQIKALEAANETNI